MQVKAEVRVKTEGETSLVTKQFASIVGGTQWDPVLSSESNEEEDDDDDDGSHPGPDPDTCAKQQATARTPKKPAQSSKPAGNKTCILCAASSASEHWFEMMESVDRRNGKIISAPTGDLCESCGYACESYPNLEPEQIKEKVKKDGDFALSFRSAQERAKLVKERPTYPASVTRLRGQGVEVYCKLAFVELSIFSAKSMDPMKVPGLKIVELPGLIGSADMTGVLMQPYMVPKEWPHWTVKFSAKDFWEWGQNSLTPEEALRSSHAKDLFNHKCDKKKGIQQHELRSIKTFQQIEAAISAEQRKLEALQEERAARMSAADAGSEPAAGIGGVRRRRGGRKVDSDGDSNGPGQTQTPKKRGANSSNTHASPGNRQSPSGQAATRPNRGRGRSSTQRGARQAGLASGSQLVVLSEHSSTEEDEEARREEQYIAILKGEDKGRELRGAFLRGTSTKHPLPAKHAEIELLHSQIGNACSALQVQKVRRSDTDRLDMLKSLALLDLHGVPLPVEIKQWVSARHAQHLMESGDFQGWANCVSLAGAAEGEVWAYDECTFRTCAPDAAAQVARTQEGLEGSDEPRELKQFKKAWIDAVFPDVFFTHLAAASGGGASPDDLVRICRAFMEENLQQTPEWAAGTFKMFRGLFALCSPVPIASQIAVSDVEFVFPTSGRGSTSAIVREGAHGKLILARTKPQVGDAVWAQRKQEFLEFAGAAAAHHESICQMTGKATDLLEQLQGDKETDFPVEDFFRELTAKLAVWTQQLRPGTLVELQRVILEIAGITFAACKENDCDLEDATIAECSVMKHLLGCLQHFRTPCAIEMLEEINVWVLDRQAKDINTNFSSAVARFQQGPSLTLLKEVLNIATLAKSQDIPPAFWAELSSVIPTSVKLATAALVLDDSQKILAKFWELVASKGYREKIPSMDIMLPEVLIRSKVANAFQRACESQDTMSAILENEPANPRAVEKASEVLDDFAEVQKNVAQGTLMPGVLHEDPASNEAFVGDVVRLIKPFESVVEQAGQIVMESVLSKVDRASHILSQSCGGAPEGKHWSESIDNFGGDIFQCFENTLKVIDIDWLIRHVTTADEVIVNWEELQNTPPQF